MNENIKDIDGLKFLNLLVKNAKAFNITREIDLNKWIIFQVAILPKEIKEEKDKMKKTKTQELKDFILLELKEIKSDIKDLNKKIDNNHQILNNKLDNHIIEFELFKTDMLVFKSDILSLPTIQKELINK